MWKDLCPLKQERGATVTTSHIPPSSTWPENLDIGFVLSCFECNWPHRATLAEQLWGNKDELIKTTSFILTTNLDV
jgi:hypothetical protein